MARVAEWRTEPLRRAPRLGGPWTWAFAGLLVVLLAVALDPGTRGAPTGGVAEFGVSAHEDWRGNSARLPETR
jgi:hypothetical protein